MPGEAPQSSPSQEETRQEEVDLPGQEQEGKGSRYYRQQEGMAPAKLSTVSSSQ